MHSNKPGIGKTRRVLGKPILFVVLIMMSSLLTLTLISFFPYQKLRPVVHSSPEIGVASNSPLDSADSVSPASARTDALNLIVTEPESLSIPCWSVKFAPDGNRYLCWQGTNELWIGSVTAGLNEKLAQPVHSYAWSPDGRAVAYTDVVNETAKPLKLLNPETRQVTEVGASELVYGMEFTSNSELVYALQGELRITNPVVGTESAVPGIQVTNDYPYNYTLVEVSPDGRKIAFVQVKHASDRYTLTILDRGTGQQIVVTDQTGTPWNTFSWSPDGRTLVYSIIGEKNRTAELWVVNADGSEPRLLCTSGRRGSYDFVTWLPNGKEILFVFMPGSGTNASTESAFQVIGIEGGEPQTLFINGGAPQLVDGGKKIVFYREDAGADGQTKAGYWMASLLQAP